MLKNRLFTFILLCFCFISYSQNSKTFIYLDYSSSKNMPDSIKDRIEKIIYQNEDDLILFISNGIEPLISTLRTKSVDNLKRLKIDYLKPPIYNLDIELINNSLLQNNFISDISNNSVNTRLDHLLNFHFFFDEDNYLNFKLNQKFIKKLLFANALYFNNGLHQDCKVLIYKEDNFKITKNIFK